MTSLPGTSTRLLVFLLSAMTAALIGCSGASSAVDTRTDGDARVDTLHDDLTPLQDVMMAPDVPPREQGGADVGGDATVAEGCAAPAQGTMAGPDVVACLGPADSVNQCQAAAYCATGWALCTASQYQLRYGVAVEPPIAVTEGLWLAGCVRDGAVPTAPVDGLCSSCGADQGSNQVVGWSCVNNVSTNTDSLHVGLRTASACTHAGTTDMTTQGFWAAWPAHALRSGALCCRK